MFEQKITLANGKLHSGCSISKSDLALTKIGQASAFKSRGIRAQT